VTRGGWTGGQASLVRALVAAAALLGLGATLVLADGWGPLGARAGMAAVLGIVAVLLLLGWRTRECAVAALAFCAMAFGLAPGPALGPLALGAALVVLAMLPAAPLLSLDARGRADPRGDWRWPALASLLARGAALLVDVAFVAWFVSGSEADPAPEAWGARVGWVLGGDAGGLGLTLAGWTWLLALGCLHLLACAPAWLSPRRQGSDPVLLFDGNCALCHGTVRWLLAEDVGALIRTAPLDGDTACERLSDEQRAGLPDSLVLLPGDGSLRLKSDATVALLGACGGLWRPLGALLGLAPRGLRDVFYDLVAANRIRVFGRPKEACPILPPDLASRLLP
jgi:predicted DCC family thiol-disulfide oxidoreductase YuxK